MWFVVSVLLCWWVSFLPSSVLVSCCSCCWWVILPSLWFYCFFVCLLGLGVLICFYTRIGLLCFCFVARIGNPFVRYGFCYLVVCLLLGVSFFMAFLSCCLVGRLFSFFRCCCCGVCFFLLLLLFGGIFSFLVVVDWEYLFFTCCCNGWRVAMSFLLIGCVLR